MESRKFDAIVKVKLHGRGPVSMINSRKKGPKVIVKCACL